MPNKRHNVPLNVYGGGYAPFREHSKHPVQGMHKDLGDDLKNAHIKKQVHSHGLRSAHVRQGFKHHPITYT